MSTGCPAVGYDGSRTKEDRMRGLAIVLLLLVCAPATAETTLTKGGAHDCGKAPAVKITTGKGTYRFKGKCTQISVNGGKNKVTVEWADKVHVGGSDNTLTIGGADDLDVGGSGNTVNIDTIGTIDVGGKRNKIRWKKAKSGDQPKVTDHAAGNTITQAK
jgi:hypothetical protein